MPGWIHVGTEALLGDAWLSGGLYRRSSYLSYLLTNITARPRGLPGLATRIRASQDDDDDGDGDDDDDDGDDVDDNFDILLKPYKKPEWLLVSCSIGARKFDIFLKPCKKPKWLYG